MKSVLRIAFLSVILIVVLSIEIIAEPRACMGKICERSFEDKITQSATHAELIVSGVFQPFKDGAGFSLSSGAVFMPLAFDVHKVYKGEIRSDVLHWQMPIYTRSSQGVSSSSGDGEPRSIALFSQDIQQLERQLEAGQIDKESYRDELRNLRIRLLHSPRSSENSLFIMHIRPGGLDAPYREVDVPIEIGKEYILFIFRDISMQSFIFRGVSMQRTIHLYDGALDVYHDEAHIRERIVHTLETHTNK